MPTFYSPSGNAEVWEDKPVGSFTVDEWHAAHPAPAPQAQTTDQLFAALRAARDALLAQADKMLLPDYPITADALEKVKTYRAALRDLPDQLGAPWPGGDIPWPAKPEV